MKRIVLLLVAICFLGSNAMAGRTYVLVAGVSSYQNAEANLPTTTVDVKRISEIMKQHTRDVSVITSRYANRNNILDKLQKIANAAQTGDRIIFYFSGHGSTGHILAYDMKPVYYYEMIDMLAASKADTKMVFIDACMSGSSTAAEETASWRKRLVDGNIVFMVASREDEYATADNMLNAGWFSHAFIKGIRGLSDANEDKNITVMELYTFVYNDVVQRSKERQHPQLIATKEHQNDVIVSW